MTEKKLRELFSLWQNRLGLDRWRVVVEIGGVTIDGAYMQCVRSVSYRRARIHVQPWVLTNDIPEGLIVQDFTPKEIECAVVHELLHCPTLPLAAMVQDDLDGMLHRDVQAVFEASFHRAEENFIEDLALALVENWPK